MTEPREDSPPLIDDEWLAVLRDRLDATDGLLACFDFDGTLAPIVEDPDDATMAPGPQEGLRRLAGLPSTHVAVVSGRSLADLRDRIDMDDVHYAGNHGLEWDHGHGRTVAPAVRESKPAMDAAVEQLRSELDDIPGAIVEDKDLTATVHLRQTPNDRVPAVAETVERVVGRSDDLNLTRGKEILELRPDAPADKGRAVERLREAYPDSLPLFVGDDITDEDGFRAAEDRGFGVLVGSRQDSAASVRVPDVDGVTMLLGWLFQACQSPNAPLSDDSRSPVG